MSTKRLILRRPDDWHLHLRDGALLAHTVAHTSRIFARAVIMPNLKPPITTVTEAKAYQERILSIAPNLNFTPLMTLYLTNTTSVEEIYAAKASSFIIGCKYYPAHGTTHAEFGLPCLGARPEILHAMQASQLPLLVHGESVEPHIDIFDREAYFITHELKPICAQFPQLKIILEHITTQEAVKFVEQADDRIAATITPHHLWLNRNDLLAGGLRPHHYCLPILKRSTHQAELRRIATSGHPRFFLGTDSAPHAIAAKQSACGCAGIYSAPHALEVYAQVFEEEHALEKLENFASCFGAQFYGLPLNTGTVELTRISWQIPELFSLGEYDVMPLGAGKIMAWKAAKV